MPDHPNAELINDDRCPAVPPGPRRARRRQGPRLAGVTAGVVAGLLGLALPASAAVHVVQPGDTLSGIAARHGTSAKALAQANGLTRLDLVIAGQTLTLPGGQGGGGGAAGSHRVASGDTLSTIAARYGVSTAALAAANGITNRNVVVIGRKLTVPSGSGTAAASPATSAAGTHQVGRGETLSHIARRYGVSTSALAAANNITNPNLVVIGRKLTVPSGGGGGSAAKAAPATSATHQVGRGETLSHIARRYGLSTSALAAANNITNPNMVVIGRKLTVPSAGGGGSAAAKTGPTPSGLPSRLKASPNRLALLPVFRHWAAKYGVPADLLMAMTWLESGWQNNVVSSTGAAGIGQLMPDTVDWLEQVIIREPLNVASPEDNIRMSARYLRWLLDRTGSTRTSLAGYYQGLRSVNEIGLYDDTVVYVDGVLALRPRFG